MPHNIGVNRKSLKKNAILNSIKTLSGIVFPLITFPYVSRVLSVESMGAYNFSSSVVSYCTLIAGLGISTYAIREGAQYRNDADRIKAFSSEIFSINVLSTIISYLVLVFLVLFVPKIQSYKKIIFILSVEILFSTIGVNWLCNIFEDFSYIAIRTIAFQLFSFIATFVFVRSSEDIYTYVFILVSASSGANLLNFFYIRRKYVPLRFLFSLNCLRHLKPILVIFSTTITITLYVSSDIMVLGFLTDDSRVGLYSAAVKIYTIIKNLLVSIVVVLVPRFSLLFGDNDKEKISNLLSRTIETISLLVLPVVTGLFMISSDIMQLIAGSKYIDATDSLRILSIATVFSLYAYIFVNCIMIPQKKESIIFFATLVSAVINIVLNFILIPLWGINAAALTTVIAELSIFLVAMSFSHQFLSLENCWGNILSIIVGCFSIIGICLVSSTISMLYVRLTIEILLSVIIYSFVLLFLKNTVFVEYLSQIKNKVRSIKK